MSKPGFLGSVDAAGEYLAKGLDVLAAKHGFGAVRALDLKAPIAGDIAAAALDAGLLLNAPRPDSLRFMPALNVSHGEIDQMLDILDQIVT